MQKGNDVVTVGSGVSVFDAIKMMYDKNIGSLVVVNDSGKLVGIFVEQDCFDKVILEDKSARDLTVKDVMTTKVIYVAPDANVDECMAIMTSKRIRHLPVLDSSKNIVGIISIGDLVKSVSSEQESTIRSLEKYIEGSL